MCKRVTLFVLELLIGKKRREVSFGFNEQESKREDASSCVYLASRSFFHSIFKRKLII